MTYLKIYSKRFQRGFTLIEILLAMMIAALVVLALTNFITRESGRIKAAAEAQRLVMLASAGQAYIQTYQTQLAALIAANVTADVGVMTPAPTPIGGSVPQTLKDAGMLPDGYSDTSPYHNTYILRIRHTQVGSADHYEGLIVKISGPAMTDESLLAQIALLGGAPVGYTKTISGPSTLLNSNIISPVGAWQLKGAQWGAPPPGSLAAYTPYIVGGGGSQGSLTAPWLARQPMSDPSLNHMTADLTMDSKSILLPAVSTNDASTTISSEGVIITSGIASGGKILLDGTKITQNGGPGANLIVRSALPPIANVNSGNIYLEGGEFRLSMGSKIRFLDTMNMIPSSTIFEATGQVLYLLSSGGGIVLDGYVNTTSGIAIGHGHDVYASHFVKYSDARLKKDIKSLKSELNKVLALEPREFVWKDSKKKEIGFIAQEIEKVYPEIVYEEKKMRGKDPKIKPYLGISYDELITVSIAALQEFYAKFVDFMKTVQEKFNEEDRRIQALEKEVAHLKVWNAQLSERVNQIGAKQLENVADKKT